VKKRSRADLYATILEVIRRYPEGGRITRVSYGVGVPVDRLKVMVEELTANGLVRRFAVEDDEGGNAGAAYCYGVTPEGAGVPRHVLEDEGVLRGLRRGRRIAMVQLALMESFN
jgi:predicted transcriptional regulator